MRFEIGDIGYIKGKIVKIEISPGNILYTLEFNMQGTNIKSTAIFSEEYILKKGEF